MLMICEVINTENLCIYNIIYKCIYNITPFFLCLYCLLNYLSSICLSTDLCIWDKTEKKKKQIKKLILIVQCGIWYFSLYSLYFQILYKEYKIDTLERKTCLLLSHSYIIITLSKTEREWKRGKMKVKEREEGGEEGRDTGCSLSWHFPFFDI